MTILRLSRDFLRKFSGLFQELLITFSGLYQDFLNTFSRLSQDFFLQVFWDFLSIYSGLSQDFYGTFPGLSQNFLRIFSGLSQDFPGISQAFFSGLSQDFLRTFSGLSQDFFRTFSRLSKDFLRTFLRLKIKLLMAFSHFSNFMSSLVMFALWSIITFVLPCFFIFILRQLERQQTFSPSVVTDYILTSSLPNIAISVLLFPMISIVVLCLKRMTLCFPLKPLAIIRTGLSRIPGKNVHLGNRIEVFWNSRGSQLAVSVKADYVWFPCKTRFGETQNCHFQNLENILKECMYNMCQYQP